MVVDWVTVCGWRGLQCVVVDWVTMCGWWGWQCVGGSDNMWLAGVTMCGW